MKIRARLSLDKVVEEVFTNYRNEREENDELGIPDYGFRLDHVEERETGGRDIILNNDHISTVGC